jgi:SAM-dependent methyltransferase
MSDTPLDYLGANTAWWASRHADQAAFGPEAWAREPQWGVFGIPDTQVGVLPPDVAGLDTVELGCGTAYVSAWLARRGARPVAIDPTASQLAIAADCQAEFGLSFPLIRAAGEAVPLPDASFDLVISEYGAAIWADPYRWIPEAARLLRPGGQLIFLGNSTLVMLCVPDLDGEAATEHLRRPQFGMHRFEWPDDPTVEFHLSHGDMIRLLRSSGFEIEDLLELRPPPDAHNSPTYNFVTVDWGRQWPAEEVWKARRIS